MTKVIKKYHTVFLPEFKTQAIITYEGEIYIAFINGYFMTKEDFTVNAIESKMFDNEMLDRRLTVYDDLRQYYEQNYRVQKKSEKDQ